MMYLKYIKYLTKVKYLNKKLNIVKMSVIIIIVIHTTCWSDLLELAGGKEVKNILVSCSSRDGDCREADMSSFSTPEATIIADETSNGSKEAKCLYYLQNIK
jgi:hypothetical protein